MLQVFHQRATNVLGVRGRDGLAVLAAAHPVNAHRHCSLTARWHAAVQAVPGTVPGTKERRDYAVATPGPPIEGMPTRLQPTPPLDGQPAKTAAAAEVSPHRRTTKRLHEPPPATPSQ